MKAEELMIGNWVNILYEDSVEAIQASGDLIHRLHSHECDPDNDRYSRGGLTDCCGPIPLTPEILEKAGFKQRIIDGMDVWEIDMASDPVSVLQWHDDGSLAIEHPEGGLVTLQANCNYVHQLQNLYFALTGQQLNIQL